MDLPKRKPNRLAEYDYSTPNVYFITICTSNRRNLFWDNAGAIIGHPLDVRLSECGRIVDQAILNISRFYPSISVDKYVVMPNHIHLLIRISNKIEGRSMIVPTNISMVIRQMKSAVSKQVGYSVWQKSFYDHVVRNDQDYLEIWEYIENNPMKWYADRMYSE